MRQRMVGSLSVEGWCPVPQSMEFYFPPHTSVWGISMPGAKCELTGSSPGGEPVTVTTSSLLVKEAQSASVRGLGGA